VELIGEPDTLGGSPQFFQPDVELFPLLNGTSEIVLTVDYQ